MKSGFSVAFGSTGCSDSAGGRAPFAPLARTPRGVRGHAPLGKFVKLDSLKCNFLRSQDRNWVRNDLFFFFFDCMHYITK